MVGRYSFWLKVAVTGGLASAAVTFFLLRAAGSVTGAFCIALSLTVLLLKPDVRRSRAALGLLAGALAFGLVLLETQSWLAWSLYWALLTMAVLMPRLARFDHLLLWAQRLFIIACCATVRPVADLVRLIWPKRPRRGKRRQGRSLKSWLGLLVLPVVSGGLFLVLFASANPLIGRIFGHVQWPVITDMMVFKAVFWLVWLIPVWMVLRPAPIQGLIQRGSDLSLAETFGLHRIPMASVVLSLLLFNLLFAVENSLDVAFLWSGAPLPGGVSLADYAHRGAYPLIATALLAGLFVILFLRPGSPTAASRPVRLLVVAWVAQNLMLVASSMLRTVDYIEVYSLTPLRIAALAWMGLVAMGLILICWRMLRGRSAAWLINANGLAAFLVLAVCTVADLNAITARWNVTHARDVGGQGAALDLCYLSRLGSPALVPVSHLAQSPIDPELRERVVWVRGQLMADLVRRQGDWRSWTWRGARRLYDAQSLLQHDSFPPTITPGPRKCDGVLTNPPQP
jgi:hypothetical protein